MKEYIKVCEICSYKNKVSDLECEECSADISYVIPTAEIEEVDLKDSNIGEENISYLEESLNEDEAGTNCTLVVERIKLVSVKDNYEVYIPVKLETVLGREGDLAKDYFNKSSFISRRHATIRLDSDGYYINDHSNNGTFINGLHLKRGQSVKIKDGDIITLADIEFQLQNI